MKKNPIIFLLLIFSFITGCSSVKVSSDFDPAVSFSGYQAYNWLPGAPKATGDPRIDGNTLLQSRIRNAVDDELNFKGFKKAEAGKADFWITFHVTLDQKTQIQTINSMNNYPYGWGGMYGGYYSNSALAGRDTFVYSYDEGSIIVDIIDANTRKLLWRGTATDQVHFSDKPEEKEQKINEAIKKLLETFPPQ